MGRDASKGKKRQPATWPDRGIRPTGTKTFASLATNKTNQLRDDQQLPPQSSNRASTDDQPYGLSEKSLTNFLREMHQHRRLRNNKNSMLSTTFKGASWTDCSHTVTRSGIQGTKGTKSRTITNINRDWVFLGQQDSTTPLPLKHHSAQREEKRQFLTLSASSAMHYHHHYYIIALTITIWFDGQHRKNFIN